MKVSDHNFAGDDTLSIEMGLIIYYLSSNPADTIRRNLVQNNNVTTLFQLHFNVVPTSDARWKGSVKTLTFENRNFLLNDFFLDSLSPRLFITK